MSRLLSNGSVLRLANEYELITKQGFSEFGKSPVQEVKKTKRTALLCCRQNDWQGNGRGVYANDIQSRVGGKLFTCLERKKSQM